MAGACGFPKFKHMLHAELRTPEFLLECGTNKLGYLSAGPALPSTNSTSFMTQSHSAVKVASWSVGTSSLISVRSGKQISRRQVSSWSKSSYDRLACLAHCERTYAFRCSKIHENLVKRMLIQIQSPSRTD